MTESTRRQDLLAGVLLILLPTIFFADVLAGWTNFYMRDLTRYYYPTKQIYREIVYGGEFPYWNRYFSAGQPIAANPEHEIFYPFTWLILLPSYNLGYRLHILIHIYIGLLGMYALLRSMELRPGAAFFGAVSFGLGGMYLSYVNLLPILFCAAWLPLTCLFVRRFLLFRRARDFALAALTLGIQFLVAEPTTVVQTGFLIGMYALYRGWHSPRRVTAMAGNVLWIAAISIAAFCVGAAQMLPAIDHVADSARSRPFDFGLVGAWSMPLAKLAEMIFPNILGHMSIDNKIWYWAGGLYKGMGAPFIFSIYPGLAVTALAIGSAFARPRAGRLVLILSVVSVVLALGRHTPVLSWLYEAGVATSVRYPEKFILIGVFAITIFAAQMFHRVLEGDDGIREAAAGFALATAVVAGVIAALGYSGWATETWLRVFGQKQSPGAMKMMELAWRDWTIAGVRGLLLVFLLLSIRSRYRRIWWTTAFVFLCADLLPVVHELNPRQPQHFFVKSPPLATMLPPNRADYRLFHEADWYPHDPDAQKYLSTGEAVYWIVRNGLFPMTPAGQGIRTVLERDYDRTLLLPTIDLVDSVWDVKRSKKRDDWWEPFMAMSNAWYRALYRSFDEESKRTGKNLKMSVPVRLIEGQHYPRYYFADQIVSIRDRRDFVEKLAQATYSLRAAFVQQKPFPVGNGVVHRIQERANGAVLDVESEGNGFLVMSVTPHKYWRIWIDGRRVRSIVTNVGYQGVPVASGRHRVVMRYENDMVKLGAVLSASAAAILLLIAVVARRPVEVA